MTPLKNSITVSAPGKIHLLGEHAVVYGKPALLATVDLRVTVTLNPLPITLSETKGINPGIYPSLIAQDDSKVPQGDNGVFQNDNLKKIIEPIIEKYLRIRTIPSYRLNIDSQLPIGTGLGSSAAVSAAYIAALLSFLEVRWDSNSINELTYEAEKVFHGNPSGGDNSTVVYGGLVWFRRETQDLKIIQPLYFSIPEKLAKNFVLINTGTPEETTKQMVEIVGTKFNSQNSKFRKIFDDQEQLVKRLLITLKDGNGNELIEIIRTGERNLESIGVVSPYVTSIIRKIEKAGGAAKICGAGGKTKATGILLCYHPDKTVVQKIARSENLPYLSTSLGVEGVKQEDFNEKV